MRLSAIEELLQQILRATPESAGPAVQAKSAITPAEKESDVKKSDEDADDDGSDNDSDVDQLMCQESREDDVSLKSSPPFKTSSTC